MLLDQFLELMMWIACECGSAVFGVLILKFGSIRGRGHEVRGERDVLCRDVRIDQPFFNYRFFMGLIRGFWSCEE